MNNALSLWNQKSHETKYEDEHDRMTLIYLNIFFACYHVDRIKHWILEKQVSKINIYTHARTYTHTHTRSFIHSVSISFTRCFYWSSFKRCYTRSDRHCSFSWLSSIERYSLYRVLITVTEHLYSDIIICKKLLLYIYVSNSVIKSIVFII